MDILPGNSLAAQLYFPIQYRPSQPTILIHRHNLLAPVPLLEGFLLLPRIPIQRPAQAINPVLATLTKGQDRRKRKPACRQCDIVARPQLHALLAVKADPGAGACVVRHAKAQHDCVRDDDRAERERVRADGCHEDDGVVRVAERAAGREVVCGRAGGGGDADAVGLYGRDVVVVTEDFDARHCCRERLAWRAVG